LFKIGASVYLCGEGLFLPGDGVGSRGLYFTESMCCSGSYLETILSLNQVV
jgi:hypothetical protein